MPSQRCSILSLAELKLFSRRAVRCWSRPGVQRSFQVPLGLGVEKSARPAQNQPRKFSGHAAAPPGFGLRWQRVGADTAFWSGTRPASEAAPHAKAVSAPCPSATALQDAAAFHPARCQPCSQISAVPKAVLKPRAVQTLRDRRASSKFAKRLECGRVHRRFSLRPLKNPPGPPGTNPESFRVTPPPRLVAASR